MKMVKCHACGAEIARFEAVDDHGSVIIECPHCKRNGRIHNQCLCVDDFDVTPGVILTQEDWLGLFFPPGCS